MREARRLLLTHPLAMVVLVLKELITGGHNEDLHLLQTNGFRLVEFGPTEQTVYALADIHDLIHLREWTLTWWSDVVMQFWALRELRAIIQLFQEWVFVRGDLSESEQGLGIAAETTFLTACNHLGDFDSLIAVFGSGKEFVRTWVDQWTGTSGTLTPLVTSFEAIYSPPQISGNFENCGMCGRQTEDPYWCKVCGEVPYCSKKCCKDHWSNGGHRRVCSLASDTKRLVKPCVVCGKASIVGCNKCMFTYYCSRECQMSHWYEGGHDKSCPGKPLPDP